MTSVELLKQHLKIADIHVLRINSAIAKAGGFFPCDADDVSSLSYDAIASLELLTNRFAKLQDLIGHKIFPLVVSISMDEDVERKTFIDILHDLEKLEFIESRKFWDEMKKARNKVSHEYPDDPEATAKELNICYEAAQKLLLFYAEFKESIEKRILLNI